MQRLRLAFALGLGAVLLSASAGQAQVTVERHIGIGTANLIAPTVTAAFDVILPRGLGVGGGGLLVVVPGWALYGVTARAGLHGRGFSRTQPFIVAELAAIGETDCCGGSTGIGVSAGMTRWRADRRSALRVEGRLLLPTRGEGGLITMQVGLTFR